ncbi:MAG: thioredoxin-like domain-containing protein [Planctomycetaceae bacterium]|nr:thioredoxin-like domain-containing protein [Planctomycetaceae bacterium]
MSALAVTAQVQAQIPSAEQILSQFKPTHYVEYDTPAANEIAACKVDVERGQGVAGFVVYGPAGQVLRRFTDTNGDNKADLFRYYRMGLEVYRDIDANKNEKPDQHRWMNWGGMKWGIDRNEDGAIDEWRVLSAQEAAQIAVESMAKNDVRGLASVLVSAEDLTAVKASPAISQQLLKAVGNPEGQLRQILTSTKALTRQTKWVRFDPSVPGLVPREDGKAGVDLTVYENAMAIVANGEAHELISVGEMIRIGEVWKLCGIPRPLDGGNAQIQVGGILMQPMLASGAVDAPPEMAKEMEDLLASLQTLDENSPSGNVTPAALANYNKQRADLIEKIIRVVPSEQERVQWIQQFADGVGAAVQTGQYNAGLKRLEALQEQVKSNDVLLGYVWYRRLMAEYAVRLQDPKEENRQQAQEWWLKQLQVFAERWPKTNDTSDAIVQLAISLELMGRVDDAKRWYTELVRDYAATNPGIRARGALRRLSLAGKPLELAGRSLTGQEISSKQYVGKVTLVVFWATWAKPYTDELPRLVGIHQKYQRSGFEILGVNLDADAAGIRDYLQKNGGNWQNIREAGGTDGKLARDFGIVSVPTMFLVDKSGRVAGAITPENLEAAVKTLLLGQPLEAIPRQGAVGTLPRRN